MKKLIKGVMSVTSIAVMAAGAYYLTKKLLAEPDEELDDEFEDFDFEDEDESDEDVSGDRSREYVTLDFDEENSDSEESAESDKKEED